MRSSSADGFEAAPAPVFIPALNRDLLYRLGRRVARIEWLDNHAVVFDAESWDTHVMNAAAAALVQAVRERPRVRAELVDLLAELLVEHERSRAAEHVDATLVDLKWLGLIEIVERP